MRKHLVLLAFFCLPFAILSQITFEHSYPGNRVSVINLSISGFKYGVLDITLKEYKIYNLDHSLWKTIDLPIPSGSTYLISVTNASEELFNLDAEVEIMYTYYNPDLTYYESKVIIENGIVILTLENCGFGYATTTGNNNWVLLTYIYGPNPSSDIYSLPGTSVNVGINEYPNSILDNPYPNPTSDIIKLPYKLPANSKSATMVIYDISGNEISRYDIDSYFDEILYDASNIPSGTYIYKIIVDDSQFDSKSFIKQ